jgi:hypothetical protein
MVLAVRCRERIFVYVPNRSPEPTRATVRLHPGGAIRAAVVFAPETRTWTGEAAPPPAPNGSVSLEVSLPPGGVRIVELTLATPPAS